MFIPAKIHARLQTVRDKLPKKLQIHVDRQNALGAQIGLFDELCWHFYWQVHAMQTSTGIPARIKPTEEYNKYFWSWFESNTPGHNPISDRRPWITFGAATALKNILTPDMRVFEYGAGGSTIFFADHVAELVTVEHDKVWMEDVKRAMRKVGGVRWLPFLAEPQERSNPNSLPPSDPLSYATSDEKLRDYSFEAYAKTIDQFDDQYFDVVSIDGRARPACFMHALQKVKDGGYILLDNAERQVYEWIEDSALARNFEILDDWGPGPYNRDFWRTIILRKRTSFHGLNDLDAKLAPFIDIDNGVFIEAGANDGIRQSNTLYLEEVRNWRGLLVEPSPLQAQKCRANRRGAIVEQVALVPPSQAGQMITLRYADLMSVVKGGMRSQEEEDAHVRAGCEIQHLQTFEFQAESATLSDLIDKHNLGKIDLLSLDVEGFELFALSGLDLKRHKPAFILVEAREPDGIFGYLNSDYEFVSKLSHHDLLFRLRS